MATLAVVVSAALLAAKLAATALTGSQAVLSDALESIVNVVAATAMLLSVRAAARPADPGHPFGHGKLESLSAGLEGALLMAAAGAMLWSAIPTLLSPRPVEHMGIGGIVIGATALVNVVLGGALVRSGKRESSAALTADGRHLIADAVSTIGVLVSLGLVALTGLLWIDPVAACVLALWVGWTGIQVLVQASQALIDTQRPEAVARIADELAACVADGMLDPHDLRVVDAGSEAFVGLHAFAPWFWDLRQVGRLRARIGERIGSTMKIPVRLNLQIEPCTTRHCSMCREPSCTTRQDEFSGSVVEPNRRLVAPELESSIDASRAVHNDPTSG